MPSEFGVCLTASAILLAISAGAEPVSSGSAPAATMPEKHRGLLGHRRFASAAASAQQPPKRMVFLGFGWGVTRETWFPEQSKTGRDYELPPGLQPLTRHKDDLTVIQNLSNQFTTSTIVPRS